MKRRKRGDVKSHQRVEDGAEKRRLVIINRPFVSPQKKCERCAEPSGMITPEEAAALCGVSTRAIYRWLETGAVHFSETSGGMVLICLKSLAAATADGAQARLKPEG